MATIKSKLYDKDTSIVPHVVGFGLQYESDGRKDFIESALHNDPLKITKIGANSIVFEEKVYTNNL